MQCQKLGARRDICGATIQRLVVVYLKMRSSLRSRSAENYRAACEGQFGDWLTKMLSEITPDMVEASQVS
jgi:hypothetical protein